MSLGEHSALVVIDVQKGFDDPAWGIRNNPTAEQQISRLLAAYRAAGMPVFHIRHASVSAAGFFKTGSDGFSHKDTAMPLAAEPIYTKSVNSAFIGTSLEKDLRAAGIETLVIVGLTTNHCVSTTARMSGNLGFRTLVVRDATATFERRDLDGILQSAEQVHASALSDLSGEFALIVSTEAILNAIAGQNSGKNEDSGEDRETGLHKQTGPSAEARAYIDRITGNLRGQDPLTVLHSSIDVIAQALLGSSADMLVARLDPQKWSVAEILAHLAETEIVLSFRLRQILSQDGIEIPAYDQDKWALISDYRSIPSTESLKRFSVNREANLNLLDRLTPVQMLMFGVHAERGVETIGHLLKMWAGHDLNHIRQVKKLLTSSEMPGPKQVSQ